MERNQKMGINDLSGGGGQFWNFGSFFPVISQCWGRGRVISLFTLIILLGFAPATLAHSDVDPEIAKVTAELAEQPNNVELLLRRGQLHRYNGHYAESIDDLDRAWTLDRNNRLVALERCRTLVALGRTSEAEAGLTEYLQEEVGASRVMALVERAHLYAGTGRAQLAIADFSEALSFYPTIELYVARGHLQEELGQLDAAVAGYLVGLNRLPQASMLRSALIRVKIAQGQYPEALTLIDQEIAGASGKTEWYVRRAEVLVAMGQTEAAANAYAQALAEANRILAKRPTALKRLTRAKVYHAMGQLDAAKQDLRLVMQAAPHLTEAETLLKKLEAQ